MGIPEENPIPDQIKKNLTTKTDSRKIIPLLLLIIIGVVLLIILLKLQKKTSIPEKPMNVHFYNY